MSKMYDDLKARYAAGYVTKDTLKKWVQVELQSTGSGITQDEYLEITGEQYA